jgi:chemotaxis protein histidine kinase CheA
MDDQPNDLEALLAGMRAEFLDTAADRVDAIATHAAGLAVEADPSASLGLLIREAHTLKGGGGIFGFSSLGDAGGRVESAAKELLALGAGAADHSPLHSAVAELQAVLAGLRRA